MVVPLYPQRGDGLDYWSQMFLGEAGPTARALGNVATGIGQLTDGDTERALNNALKVAPVIAPFTGTRHWLVDKAHGKPDRDAEGKPEDNLLNYLIN